MVTIKLLGRPAIFGDGIAFKGPRGKKSWGLLTYLVGSGAAIPRERLTRLFFPDAEDGLAALRWNLAELRRSTRQLQAFASDPVGLALGRDVQIDVQLLAAAPWYEVTDQIDLGAPLLEGLTFPSCPASSCGSRVSASGWSRSPPERCARQLVRRPRPAARIRPSSMRGAWWRSSRGTRTVTNC